MQAWSPQAPEGTFLSERSLAVMKLKPHSAQSTAIPLRRGLLPLRRRQPQVLGIDLVSRGSAA